MAITTLSYDYESFGGDPPAGCCYQTTSQPNLVLFSYTDNQAVPVDQTTFLQSVVVDDQITVNGVTWIITAVQQSTDSVTFTVDPAVDAPPLGASDFSFSQAGQAPNITSVTVTDVDEGTTIATNGLLFSVQFVTAQSGDYHDTFSLVDDSAGEVPLFSMHPAVQYISPGAIYPISGHPFGNLTVKSIPQGSSFTIEYSPQGV
jgi:hypothetical protein